ncbi:MAG: hypothetical protein MSB10_08245 [Clostridiales bacterium]|uniref:hypothetical protein n=1 Tax=Flavonifractor TaxID=946234 RepID=UPI000B393B0C|nr:hypothetical protein [Flavonifractor sp. An91]MCI7473649.1 hypothetical protein [Clostridiales bacterium]OUN10248.1 hypothetical protein B5G42_10985 [Flavonifractor sp. An91]
MDGYNGAFTGQQIDEAIGTVLRSGAKTVPFTSGQWSGGTLRIGASSHGLKSGAFHYVLQQRVSDVLKSGTWAVAGTSVTYESESGDVVLTSVTAFDGSITFFGQQKDPTQAVK